MNRHPQPLSQGKRGNPGRALGTLLFLAASPAVAVEPPGAWFLNAHFTGSDPYVYFSVGGSAEVPPLAPDEVVLGWSWDEAGTPVELYPGDLPVRYRTSAVEEKKPRQWRVKSSRVGHPPLAVGPGNELLFLGDDDRATANALAWAELLDAVEAAYRHSSPDLTGAERRGELVVGLLGGCPIRSRPVDGEAPGWAPLSLPGHARPSRAGGFFYVEDTRAPAGRRGTIEVRRFLRRVESGAACSGDDLDLRLFPTPRGEALAYAYFLIWKDADVLSAGFLDLEPEPMTPAVRRVAVRARRERSERANLGRWPEEDRDLCGDPLVGELCRRDLAIRRRLATSLGPGGLRAARERCRGLLRSLGAAGDPCSDPRAWSSKSGLYLTGYRGDLPLVADRLESRWDSKGSVEWKWIGRAVQEPVDFALADGTRIRLSLPAQAVPAHAVPARARPATAAIRPPLPSGERAGVRRDPGGEIVTAQLPEASAPSPQGAMELAVERDSGRERGSEPLGEAAPTETASSESLPSEDAPADGTPSDGTPADGTPSDGTPSESGSIWSVEGLPAFRWQAPMVIGAPAALFVLLAVRLLRRSASRPRRRTSFVLKVRSPPPLPPGNGGEEPLGDLPLVLSDGGSADEVFPAVDSWETVEAEPPPDEGSPPDDGEAHAGETPLPSPEADDREALEQDERRELLRALDAGRRLAEWVASVLPVFREIEEARGVVRFDSLPLPARREWIDAYDTLRRFVESFPRRSLTLEEPAALDLPDDPDLSLKERLRRRLLAADGPGLVHGVVLALQYLLEAFPVEQLDAGDRRAYKAAVRDRLGEAGIPPRLHELVGDLAGGLGLTYLPVRYYKCEIGQAGFDFLDDACDQLSLAALVGYEAGTEGPTVVRLKELFLVDRATGAPYSGRAAVDRRDPATPGRS